MSLFDIKKNADEKAAQELAERQRQELMRKLDVHPLVNLECGRDVRDSYFAGIVFASLTDDETVDDVERKQLLRIANSLGLSEEDRELIITNACSAIAEMVKSAAQQVFDLLEEVAVALKEDAASKIFVAEFVKVCAVKKFEVYLVKDTLAKYVVPQSGHKMEAVPFDALCRVVQSGRDFNRDDLLKLSDWLGEDATRYLMLDVFEDDVKPILDAHRTMLANRAALPEKLVKIIESDDTWPVEFKPADYQPLFDAAGIAEADAGAFVARELLPFMKQACEVAKTKIGEVKVIHDDDSWKSDDDRYHGAKFETVKEFCALFRYAFFVDAFVDLNGIYEKYYFIGPQEGDHEYYLVSLTSHEDHITFKRIGAERFEGVERALCPFGSFGFPDVLFDRMRCGWGIYDDDIKRYFARWEELFAAIEKRFVVNNSQDGGTAIRG